MQKNGRGRFAGFHQMCIAMKLTTLLLTVALMEAHGGGFAQNVTLSGQHLSLKKIFSEIKHQTGYAFFYNYTLLKEAHPVNLDVKEAPLAQVLSLCFAGQPLDFDIENKTVVITRRAEAEASANPVAAPRKMEDGQADIITVRGKVTDDKGNPIAGASVKLKGGKTGTATNADGVFSIRVPSGSVLVVSNVGYMPKEITVDKEETIAVQLLPANKSVDDVVITGFGESRQRRSLGYSVQQISGDQIRATAQINPINALQGMVTGLQVQPGVAGQASTPKVLLRGANSFNTYGNMPLVVVDGVILDEQSVTQSEGTGADFGNILKDLNPDDIESLSVLKGGAVTALYGSRASNGVLLIKTKKGIAQKGLGVSLSENYLVDKAYKTTDLQNTYGGGFWADDWITGPNGMLQYDTPDWGISFGPEMTGQTFLDITGQVRKNNPMPNSILDLFQTGHSSTTSVALSGGNENTTVRMSYSHLSSNSVLPMNKFDRNNFMLRATQRVGSKVMIDANASYVHSYNLNPPQQGGASPLYQVVYDGQRNYDVGYWSKHYFDSANGGVNNNDVTTTSQNAFWPLYANKYFQNEDNLRGGVDVTANLLPSLTFSGNASLNLYDVNYQTDQRGQLPGYANPYYGGSVTDLLQTRYRAQLLYSKTFHKFTTSLAGGVDAFNSSQTGNSYNTNTGLLPDIYRLSNSANPATLTENKPAKYQLNSLYFQGSIGYHDFLTANVYGRNDWNSNLVYTDGHGKYSYFYWGVDGAFVFSDLIKGKPSFFNFGKLRLSYVTAGNGVNPGNGNEGDYLTNAGAYQSNGAYTGARAGGSISSYSYQTFNGTNTLSNLHLSPEASYKEEAGLELRFFHNRLGGDFTFYNQTTKSEIIQFGVPQTSGVSAYLLNGGEIRNRGLEFSINATPIQTRNFAWTTRFLYTHNSNKVIDLPLGVTYMSLNGEDGIQTVAQKGGDYGTMVASYGYARYQDPQGKLTGQPVLTMTGNGTVAEYVRATNYGTTPATQQPAVGNINPKFLGSWSNTFTYKGFSLGIFLDARFGGIEWSSSYYYGSQNGSVKSTLFGRTKALGGLTFTPAKSTSQLYGFPLGTAPRNDGIALHGVFQQGSMSVGTDGATHDVSGMTFDQALTKGFVLPVDAADYYVNTYSWGTGIREAGVFTNSWVSLREVSFGYDIPSSFTRRIKLNNLRATLIGRNLLYLYNSAPDHINPENQNNSGAGNAFEDGGVPYVRSYGFMLSTNF